jgi:hypothetical protein
MLDVESFGFLLEGSQGGLLRPVKLVYDGVIYPLRKGARPTSVTGIRAYSRQTKTSLTLTSIIPEVSFRRFGTSMRTCPILPYFSLSGSGELSRILELS